MSDGGPDQPLFAVTGPVYAVSRTMDRGSRQVRGGGATHSARGPGQRPPAVFAAPSGLSSG